MSNALIQHMFQEKAVRTLVDNQKEVWFVAKDVAEALGYEDTKKAIKQHCKKQRALEHVVSLELSDVGGVSPPTSNKPPISSTNTSPLPRHPKQSDSAFETTLLIPESDLYRLIMRSRLPSAEAFQDWVFEEVLPSIRKTGKYGRASRQFYLEHEKASLEGFEAFSKLSYSQKIGVVCALKEAGDPVANYLAVDSHIDLAYMSPGRLSKKLGYSRIKYLMDDLEKAGLVDDYQLLTPLGHRYGEYHGPDITWSITVVDELKKIWEERNDEVWSPSRF